MQGKWNTEEDLKTKVPSKKGRLGFINEVSDHVEVSALHFDDHTLALAENMVLLTSEKRICESRP